MVINIEKIDDKYKNMYSCYSKMCIDKLGMKSNIISKKDLQIGQILISPYLFFKSININNALEYDDFDVFVFCETPIIDVLDGYKIPKNIKPSYDTRLIGFNNQKILNEYIDYNLSGEQLYEYCKKNNYKVKCLFGNILVDEKMKIFGVKWIKEEMRDFIVDGVEKYLIDNHYIGKTDTIDYVFPYVNYNDEEWQKIYKQKISSLNIDIAGDATANGIIRYKDYGILDAKMKSIYKNMSWINNIYMLVSCETQLPNDFCTKYPNVKIVYHKDFIPNEFLPTFNSNTIEMFLGNIPGLSEKFIYSNDDIIVNSETTPSFYFRHNLPVVHLRKRKKEHKETELSRHADRLHYNGLNLMRNDDYDGFIEDETYMLSCNHADKPLLKSICNEVLIKYKDEIYKSISDFRDEKNLNIYSFLFYMTFNRKCVHGILPYKSINYTTIEDLEVLKDYRFKNISIDFIEDVDEEEIMKIKEWLQNWIHN